MKTLFKILTFSLAIALHSCSNEQQGKSDEENQIHNESDGTTDGNKSANSSETSSEINNELLFDIEGDYSFQEGGNGCRIDLRLFYLNGQLKYDIKINTRKISSNARIDLNEGKDGYYIKLEDIEWSEYQGEVDAEGKPIEKNLSLPKVVEGVLHKDEISIQNYGNAMNYFVVFGECDEKYILLKRNGNRAN